MKYDSSCDSVLPPALSWWFSVHLKVKVDFGSAIFQVYIYVMSLIEIFGYKL